MSAIRAKTELIREYLVFTAVWFVLFYYFFTIWSFVASSSSFKFFFEEDVA